MLLITLAHLIFVSFMATHAVYGPRRSVARAALLLAVGAAVVAGAAPFVSILMLLIAWSLGSTLIASQLQRKLCRPR